jgi:hypothetical protein
MAKVSEFCIFKYKSRRLIELLSLSVLLLPFLALAENAADGERTVCVSSDKRDCFESSFSVGRTKIELIGATFFKWFLFDVYSAALYSDNNFAARKSFDGSSPAALQIRYRRSFRAQEMIETAEKVLRNQGAPIDLLKTRLDKINSSYVDVRDGDSYTLVYTPEGEGSTSLIYNGRVLTTVPGKDFAASYFNIWLAEKNPFDEPLREALVNLKCDRPYLACI